MLQKIYLVLTFIVLFSLSLKAEVITTIHPSSYDIEVTTAANNDTLSIYIQNLSPEPITNFFITAVTTYGVNTIQNIVDESATKRLSIEVENSTVYIDKYTTRWYVSSINKSVELRIQTSNLTNQYLTFCGSRTSPFFGIITPVGTSCCVGYRGNVNYDPDDIIDIEDLVYLVNYSFGDPIGPAPVCFDEADVNADDNLDIGDIVYLVSFMFTPQSPRPRDCM